MKKLVTVVDIKDNILEYIPKLHAHQQGILHRAFSIFIFNRVGEMLLQQRALTKYHSGGLWTNACCSHPAPGEETEAAAHRRLREEMGFDCELRKVFDFIYRAELDHGLIEHEFDHVFVGNYESEIVPDPDEVAAFKWITLDNLKADVEKQPEIYTVWFKIALEKVLAQVENLTDNRD